MEEDGVTAILRYSPSIGWRVWGNSQTTLDRIAILQIGNLLYIRQEC